MSEIAPVITVDGPSGAGKGAVCKALAETLRWHLLDSGAIYRVLALAAQRHRIDISAERALVLLAENLDVCFLPQNGEVQVISEGENLSAHIRTEIVGKIASQLATFPRVREALLCRQRAFRGMPGLVADGRDMGSVVFPDACVKIFLDACAQERARRRMLQLQAGGFNVIFGALLAGIKQRDFRDRNRPVAPLVAPDGALVLDSTGIPIEQVIGQALCYARKVLGLS